MLKTLALLAICGASAFALTCSNSGGDPGAIQSALNGGGTVTITGTCAIGGTTLTVGSNTTVTGTATLNYSGGGYIFQSSGNSNTITGLTLNGGGINLNGGVQNGWTITGNTIRNITSTSGGVSINILGEGAHSTISNNTFTNIWPGGYPNGLGLPYGSNGCSPSSCFMGLVDSSGGGIFWNNGLDNTLIDGNTFSEFAGNAIQGFQDGLAGNTNGFVSHNIVISNNDIQLEGRIGIEVQVVGKGSCPGGCSRYNGQNVGTTIKGNYVHNFPSPVNNEFAYSLMWGGNQL